MESDKTSTQSAGAAVYAGWITTEEQDLTNASLGYDTKPSNGEASSLEL